MYRHALAKSPLARTAVMLFPVLLMLTRPLSASAFSPDDPPPMCTCECTCTVPAQEDGPPAEEPPAEGRSDGMDVQETVPTEEVSDGTSTQEWSGPLPDLILNELFPDPDGTDADSEFIELKNLSGFDAPLTGWVLRDGKSRSFILDGISVPAGSVRSLPYSMTGIPLVNSGGALDLLDPAGTIVDSVTYDDARTGASFARNSASAWGWTDTPTPDAENVFPGPEHTDEPMGEGSSDTGSQETGTEPIDLQVGQASDTASADAVTAPEEETTPSAEVVAIAALDDLPEDSMVTFFGTVSLAPGIVGKTIFAAQDGTGSHGVFVRMYGKTRPDLEKGDDITVTGRVRRSDDIVSIAAISGGVVKSGLRSDIDHPLQDIDDIDEGDIGIATSVRGTVFDSGKSWVLLSDTDGIGEITVTLPEGATTGPVSVGDTMTADGVIRFRRDAFEIVVPGREALTTETEQISFSDLIPAAHAASTSPSSSEEREGSDGVVTAMFLLLGAGVMMMAYRRVKVRPIKS